MSVEENKAFIRRYSDEIYNEKILDNIFDHVSEELSLEHLQQFFDAFPDSKTTILDIFGEGDKVFTRLLVEGTNLGPFAGQPPTGKKIQFESYRVFRIQDNKIAESWAMQDRLGLMEQLGFTLQAGEVNWGSGDELKK